MSLARLVITAVEVEGRSKAEVARTYGLSRRWVQKLCLRYGEEGEAAFAPRSRRPKWTPNQTPGTVEDEIVALRKALSEEGLDAGAATIAYHLEKRLGQAPALSTIWRVLHRRGFVTPQPHKRPRSSIIRFQAEQPNERWQADITHWTLRSGREVEILNQLDDHSRLLVGSDARLVFKSADVLECFAEASARYGVPANYLTDNGAVFTGAYRGHGWVALERALIEGGTTPRHSRPYHPQTCGKVERFHQTLKQWLRCQRRARSTPELQRQLDTFAEYYNTVRPHRASAGARRHSRMRSGPRRCPQTAASISPIPASGATSSTNTGR
ncbi:MAG TPA: IS481 family transposase [Acidimicrobiales bacterium]|nr:IS481 family transposase [Acidimicrobiales bacterium]